MEKDYIDRKLKQCRKLVRDSTSDAQKEVYRGYLKFWQEKEGPKPIKPKKTKKEKKKPEKVAEIVEVDLGPPLNEEEAVAIIKDILEPINEAAAKAEAEIIEEILEPENFQTLKEATGLSVQDLLDNPILPETPIDYAAEFEKEFPNKMAYRRKDGKLVETIAFKEFLINKPKTQ